MDYLNRCLQTLEEWGAPLEGWYCVGVEDVFEEEDGTYCTCELCGCQKVRYRHYMEHDDYCEVLPVGCVCAGILEGDILAPKERERKLRNKAKRRETFAKKEWKTARNGAKYRRENGENIFINQTRNGFSCTYHGKRVYSYKNKPIKTFKTATYAAFELVEELVC